MIPPPPQAVKQGETVVIPITSITQFLLGFVTWLDTGLFAGL